eukprot:130190-Chlamydomonas_euryale.AAC.4
MHGTFVRFNTYGSYARDMRASPFCVVSWQCSVVFSSWHAWRLILRHGAEGGDQFSTLKGPYSLPCLHSPTRAVCNRTTTTTTTTTTQGCTVRPVRTAGGYGT